MPQWPHYYIVRNNENEDDFVELVKIIRSEGTPEPFLEKTYLYLQIGEYKYWTMGNPIEGTTIINRCR